jgi:hypothetical protein
LGLPLAETGTAAKGFNGLFDMPRSSKHYATAKRTRYFMPNIAGGLSSNERLCHAINRTIHGRRGRRSIKNRSARFTDSVFAFTGYDCSWFVIHAGKLSDPLLDVNTLGVVSEYFRQAVRNMAGCKRGAEAGELFTGTEVATVEEIEG